MTVHAVVRRIDLATDEPFPERRVAGIEDGVIWLEPGQHIRIFSEAIRKLVEPELFEHVRVPQIAVHWKEEEYYQPSEKFKAQANMRDPHVFEKFGLDKFPDCFREYADMLTWFEPYHTVLDTSDAPFWKWFVGGKINASYNCVDRHLPT